MMRVRVAHLIQVIPVDGDAGGHELVKAVRYEGQDQGLVVRPELLLHQLLGQYGEDTERGVHVFTVRNKTSLGKKVLSTFH